ncbi:MAG: pilus assembly protein [Legionellales bacterium]|nr:pilus assembly protein [Legionellales bacterium]
MNTSRTTPRGSALIVTLLMLLMLTVLAVSEVSLNSTQTRIATNSADVQVAFQTAEGALNAAINNVLANPSPASSFIAKTNGLYLYDPTSAPLWTTINWSSTNAVISSFQGNSNAQSAYFVELLPSVLKGGQNNNTPTWIYRITVRAVGASGGSPVILQSTVQSQ